MEGLASQTLHVYIIRLLYEVNSDICSDQCMYIHVHVTRELDPLLRVGNYYSVSERGSSTIAID